MQAARNILQAQQDGLIARLRLRGEAVLHHQADGGQEWLWGVLQKPMVDTGVEGVQIDLQDYAPRFRLLASDALDVCPWRETHFAGTDNGSRLVIRGKEYAVRDKHITDIGEAIIALASDCSPVTNPLVAPVCMAAVVAANSGADGC